VGGAHSAVLSGHEKQYISVAAQVLICRYFIDAVRTSKSRNLIPICDKQRRRPRGENVVDLMDALRKSIGGVAAAATDAPKKPARKARKAAAGQKEMLMPIAGKKPARESASKKLAAKPQRKSA
jgi:hypothetical protein